MRSGQRRTRRKLQPLLAEVDERIFGPSWDPDVSDTNGRSARRKILSIFVSLAVVYSIFLAVIPASAANASANLDQCANDPAPSSPTDGCNSSATQWVNGNLGASKSVYREGDSIPYRLTFSNLTLASHTVTIEWDTTKSGTHAIDYLTTFNQSVLDANPCLGVSPCGSPTTFAIPADPQVTGAGVTPIAGNFTFYGGAITGVSAYSYPTGTGFAGDKSARITITFTATQANPVLAWGGHIATRKDWGIGKSAVNIPGSPYHTRLIDLDGSGGNQDRSLSAAAVIFPAMITIIKDDVTPNTDSQSFPFSATGGEMSPTSFSLADDGVAGHNTQTFNNLVTFPSTRTVTEGTLPLNWSFTGFTNCTVSGGGGTPGTVTTDTGARTATFDLNEANIATCTFQNSRQAPNLSITKTPDNATVDAGQQIGYTITVSNAGPGTATGVTMTDTLPTNPGLNWSFDTVTGGWTCAINTGTLTCGGGSFNLASGASASVHIVSPTTSATCPVVNNTASVSASNQSTVSTGVVSITVDCPSISVTKTPDQGTVDAGHTIGYVITVTAGGTGTAKDVTMTDTVPTTAGTSWSIVAADTTGGWTCAISGGVLTCGGVGFNLATGASASVHITSPTTTDSCGTVHNTADVSTSNDGSGTNSADITVDCPHVSQITPTGTTCDQFRTSSATTLSTLNYTVKNGLVSTVTPGVFFYWVKLQNIAAGSNNTFTISQTITTGNFDSHFFNQASGSFVWTSTCTKQPADISTTNGVTTVTFTAGSGGTYFIGIKYNSKSVEGFTAPSPTTVHYDFSTTGVSNSTSGLDLVKK